MLVCYLKFIISVRIKSSKFTAKLKIVVHFEKAGGESAVVNIGSVTLEVHIDFAFLRTSENIQTVFSK